MAHFYGNLKGSRGEATRCGTRQSGIMVSARSWNGSVSVEMGEGETHDDPQVIIRAGDGSTIGGARYIAAPFRACSTRITSSQRARTLRGACSVYPRHPRRDPPPLLVRRDGSRRPHAAQRPERIGP